MERSGNPSRRSLVWLFWPAVAAATVSGLGVANWYYGGDVPELSKRLGLWSNTLAWPFQVLTFPLLFATFSKTRPEELGLTTRRLGRNVLAGAVGTIALTPPVFGINWFVTHLYLWAGQEGVEKHPLDIIAQQGLFRAEWAILIFSATVAAPILEELSFRGVLQPWLAGRRWRGHLTMLGSLAVTIAYRWSDLLDAWPKGVPALATAATPALFVLALLPLYLLMCWRGRTPLGPAIFAASLLFACVHATVWPTPVPLFVLALGLGILAYRTRSLVGPIVLHGLFNAVSCVQLLMGS